MSRSSSRDVSAPLLHRDGRSRSRPDSPTRPPRHSTNNLVPPMNHAPEDLIIPSALITEEDVELVNELIHPHERHHALEHTFVKDAEPTDVLLGEADEEEEYDHEWRQKLSWWKRPSPWWFLCYVPFAAIAMTITIAAKIELFTYLACQAHKPNVHPGDQGTDLVLIARNVISSFGEPSQRTCAQDPVVQAAVAKLSVITTTSMGILACMTAAWWGSLSDRYGRTPVLSCSIVGVLFLDVTCISVFWFHNYIPGGYWFLVVGPIVGGLLGGQAVIDAAMYAYIADCTPPSLRSGLFSLQLGLMMAGVGIGPALGGLVIRLTGQFILVFYISAIIHTLYAIFVWFIIPESLSRAEMLEARARHKTAEEEYRSAHAHGGVLVFINRLFSFLTPLSIVLPVDINDGNPVKGKKRDWSLLLIAITFGCMASLGGMYSYIIQFLTGVYGWNTEEVGYWFSSLGAARAVFLTLVLPLIIRLTKPKAPIQLPMEPEEPLTNPPEHPRTSRSPSSSRHAPHSPTFDLKLARVSLAIEVVMYAIVVCSTTGLMFALATGLGALAMGCGPAMQSVALTLYNRRGGKDSGKLFGALSVVQAISAQVFGPFVYGLTYARTVGTFPRTIFVVACGVVFTAFVLLMLVRLPKDLGRPGVVDVEEQEGSVPRVEREDSLVDVTEPLTRGSG